MLFGVEEGTSANNFPKKSVECHENPFPMGIPSMLHAIGAQLPVQEESTLQEVAAGADFEGWHRVCSVGVDLRVDT
jgi:hypothetical protein